MTTKQELDILVSIETGIGLARTSAVTGVFLQKLMEAIIERKEVRIKRFGCFKLALQGGGPPPDKRFGARDNTRGRQSLRFRVHFSKSLTFATAVKEKYKEKNHGKVWRR